MLISSTGIGLFNVLAFRGVFFRSPFAKSDCFRWFDRFEDWECFTVDKKEEATKDNRIEEEYYVKRNWYGRSQKEHNTKLLKEYWEQRDLWNKIFNQPTQPTIEEAYAWLTASDLGVTRFRNIGALSAILICGDLIEAGVVAMPSAMEFGELIHKVGKGAKDGMVMFNLVKKNADKEEICKAFSSLDLALQCELTEVEKEAMGYNIVMLEHTLCKIKRLTS